MTYRLIRSRDMPRKRSLAQNSVANQNYYFIDKHSDRLRLFTLCRQRTRVSHNHSLFTRSKMPHTSAMNNDEINH